MAGNFIFYALDTTYNSIPIELFINGNPYGEYHTGRKYRFDIGLGRKEIYVIVKQGTASFMSDKILLSDLKVGETVTLYAGYRQSSLKDIGQDSFMNVLASRYCRVSVLLRV